jgi:hypothetical protein
MSTSDGEFPPEVLARIDQARSARLAIQTKDPEFFAAVSGAMFQHDLLGINFGDNTDEYDAEAGTVIPRLGACFSVEDTARVLHEEFVAWFGSETAGDIASFRALASDVWRLKRERDA